MLSGLYGMVCIDSVLSNLLLMFLQLQRRQRAGDIEDRRSIVHIATTLLIEHLVSELHIFNSEDSADVNDTESGTDYLAIEYLHSLNPSSLPP